MAKKRKKKKNNTYIPKYGLGGLFASLFGGRKRKSKQIGKEADEALNLFKDPTTGGLPDYMQQYLAINPSATALEAKEKGIDEFYAGIEPPEVDTDAFEKGQEMRKATEATTIQQAGRLTPEQQQQQLSAIHKKSLEADVAAGEELAKLDNEADKLEYEMDLKKAGAATEYDKAMTEAIAQQEYDASKTMSDIGVQYLEGLAESKAAADTLELQQQEQLWGGIGDVAGSFIGIAKDGMSVDKEVIQQNNNNMEEEMQMQPGEPEVSPGEENHDKNPIDLVQNGEKIGELTGGEFIVPSKAADKISEFLAKGEAENLFALMDGLVSKWKEKAAQDEEKMAQSLEQQGAPQGGPMMPPGGPMMPPGGPMGGPGGGQPMPEELAALTGAMNMAAAGAYLRKQ